MISPRKLNIRPRPEMTEVSDREVKRDPHLARHNDKTHIPPQQRDDKQQPAAGLLDLARDLVLALRDLPVRGRQDPAGRRDEQEDGGEDGVDLAGEDEEGEEGEAPDDQVQGDGVVELGAAVARRVGRCGVAGAEL